MPHPDAQPVALDELAALVGDVVRDLGGVERLVNEPRERLDLAEGLLVKDARFVVQGKEAVLKTDFPIEIRNGGFEDFTGNQVRGCRFHDLPGKVSFIDTEVAKEGKASLRFEKFGQFPHGHGRVMFEVGGTNRETALEALRLASHKLPIKTKVSVRPDYEGHAS